MSVLKLYKKMRRKFINENGKIVPVTIWLTPKFLKICESRIIAGMVKYGDDWKTKDNLAEAEFEKYDIFNYIILDLCQKKERGD